MSDPASLPAGAGLCGRCRNARAVASRRGSRFVLCELSRTNSAYPRYPALPVVRCDGFEKLDGTPAMDQPNR